MSIRIVAPVVDEHEIIEEGVGRLGEFGRRTAPDAQPHDQRFDDYPACQANDADCVFEQFAKFFRRHHEGDGSREEEQNVDQPYVLKARRFPGADPSHEVQATRSLWKNEREAIGSGTSIWEHEEISSMNFEWEHTLKNTSIMAGLEDWVGQLEVPEVPDSRVKLIFTSICAERKKLEWCNQIEESLLKTDSELCPLVIQLQINRTLERFRLIKYSVETIEDALILLSRATVEPRQRDSVIEELAATIHGDVLDELMQSSHARSLLLVSLGILLDSDFKLHALEVLKQLISRVAREDVDPCSNGRKSLLAGIIERCTPVESMWIREELLALNKKNSDNPVSEFCATIDRLLPKESEASHRKIESRKS